MATANVSKLHQVLAVLPDAKNRAKAVTDGVYHQIQKNTGPLNGLIRTYKPKDDEGDRLPDERTLVQIRVPELLTNLADAVGDVLNLEYTETDANTQARANVVIDGEVLLENVPATYLIFLEKQLTDLATIAKKLPTLDPAEQWHWDPNSDAYATEPSQTTRTQKVPKNHILAPATDKHPAQVHMFHEDQIVGYWTKVQYSGAIPGSVKVALVRRIESLKQAVKSARAEANAHPVTQEKELGKTVFDYLLSPVSDLR